MFCFDGRPEMYLSGFLTPKRSPEKINDSCVGCRSGGFLFTEVFLSHFFCIFRFSKLTYLKKKKNTHKDTMHSSPVLLAHLSQWWHEAHEAYNTSVDSPVELAVYGLCQSGIKKCQAECKGCCCCSEAQHPQPSLVAHTFISNTAGVLMRTVA